MLYWEKITYSLKLKRSDYWIYIYSFSNYESNLVSVWILLTDYFSSVCKVKSVLKYSTKDSLWSCSSASLLAWYSKGILRILESPGSNFIQPLISEMTSFNIWCQRKQNATRSGLFQSSFLTFCRAFEKKAFLSSDRFQLNLEFMGLCRNMKGNSRIPAAPECQNTGMR